jgi:polyisoprenoid-binding protein YceI
MKFFPSLAALTLLPLATTAYSQTLPIDPGHTAVVFSWDHRGLSHPVARLEKVEGSVDLDAADMSRSSVTVTLPLEGLRTADDFLDKRLKTPEFLDAVAYPQITFRSTRVEVPHPGALLITGDLSVHGVTRTVVLDATVNSIKIGPDGKQEAGFDADVRLRRSDFGVGKYVPMVGDELVVHITLEARAD